MHYSSPIIFYWQFVGVSILLTVHTYWCMHVCIFATGPALPYVVFSGVLFHNNYDGHQTNMLVIYIIN